MTGASRGIGAAVALLMAEQGADLVINYRSKAARADEIARSVAISLINALTSMI